MAGGAPSARLEGVGLGKAVLGVPGECSQRLTRRRHDWVGIAQ